MWTPPLVVALCFLLSHLLSQVHRRQKKLEVESGKGDFVSTKKFWTLPKSCGSQSSESEERKKSRAKRGSLCTRRRSRKTVFAWYPCIIRPQCEADGGAGGELRDRASLAAVSFSRHIRLCRRPVKWTRTRKAGSRSNVTRDFVCLSTLFCFAKKFNHKTSAAGFFIEPLEPDTGKPCENSLKTHLIVPLFF